LAIVGDNLWFVEQQDDYATELTPAAPINGSGAIGRLPLTNPTNDKIVEYQLPVMHSRPMGITPGSDGNLWVTEAGVNKLAQFSTDGKLLAEFPVSGAPDDIVTGSDGNLYFTGGGAFEWKAQSHTDGLIGDQFPAWNMAPSTLQKFVVR
jgi:streptogramin lyase